MRLVRADYIEDPGSVAPRIPAHDHRFTFWLVDEECHEIIRGWLAVPR